MKTLRLISPVQTEEGFQAAVGGDRVRDAREEAGGGPRAVHGPGVLGGSPGDREAPDIRPPPAGAGQPLQEELPGAAAGEGGPLLPVQVEPGRDRDPGRHHGDHRQLGGGREVQGSGQDGRGQKTAAIPGELIGESDRVGNV